MIMRPFDFDTLAVQAHRLASDERLAAAAVPSLVIAAIGLLPVILICRAIAGQRPAAPAPARACRAECERPVSHACDSGSYGIRLLRPGPPGVRRDAATFNSRICPSTNPRAPATPRAGRRRARQAGARGLQADGPGHPPRPPRARAPAAEPARRNASLTPVRPLASRPASNSAGARTSSYSYCVDYKSAALN